jgi:nicotinate (nicotinamide) nucleotide adenylyltransferase
MTRTATLPSASQSQPDWSSITAIYGGTFDPPHLGHVEVARGLKRLPGVKRTVILPTGHSPWKSTQLPAESRRELIQLAFQKEAELDWTDWSLSYSQNRAIRAWESIPLLTEKWGPVAWVIGSDQIASLSKWERFPEILALCHWIWVERKSEGDADNVAASTELQAFESSGFLSKISEHLWAIKNSPFYFTKTRTEAPGVSSTEIRRSIAVTGVAPAAALPFKVEEKIRTSGHYGHKLPSKEKIK